GESCRDLGSFTRPLNYFNAVVREHYFGASFERTIGNSEGKCCGPVRAASKSSFSVRTYEFNVHRHLGRWTARVCEDGPKKNKRRAVVVRTRGADCYCLPSTQSSRPKRCFNQSGGVRVDLTSSPAMKRATS